MRPKIEFSHILNELSLNRNDPCEVIRELISNSYDANSSRIFYSPIRESQGIIFLDNGDGLNYQDQKNGITPWEAFFSIGKSTKTKGNSIGHKCQGSKLCFASKRILVASKPKNLAPRWVFKIIENPRNNLNENYDISYSETDDIKKLATEFFTNQSAETEKSINALQQELDSGKYPNGTLIIIDDFDSTNFSRHFIPTENVEDSYIYNYIKFYTVHGDVRFIQKTQGFSDTQIQQIANGIQKAELFVFNEKDIIPIPFGYHYLPAHNPSDPPAKSPKEISRMKDGRFYGRAAKKITINNEKFSLIFAIDGNRRAHEGYINLDRKGSRKSGIKLSEQRGLFISVKGVKVCKYNELFEHLNDFKILSESDSLQHFTFIIDGNFDLVTNRTSLSKGAIEKLTSIDFISQINSFLSTLVTNNNIFSELLSRLKRESTEHLLNEQIVLLNKYQENLKKRERFNIKNQYTDKNIFLSPQPGEEYSVGVLYAQLGQLVDKDHPLKSYWKKVLTFSTQGIDSMGLIDEKAQKFLDKSNICSIEYKYDFSEKGSFNHSLAIVDYIIAWEVSATAPCQICDTYTCFGNFEKIPSNSFEWLISSIESTDGSIYETSKVTVINLKKLIEETFENIIFSIPPSR